MLTVMYSRPPLLVEVQANTHAELAKKIEEMDARIEAMEARRLDMLAAAPAPSEEA